MIEKKIKKPVYEYKRKKTGEEEVIVYTTVDGKEFYNKKSCEKYELIYKAKKDIENILLKIDEFSYSVILNLFFEANNFQVYVFINGMSKKNKNKEIEKIINYFKLKGYYSYDVDILNNELKRFHVNDDVLIATWVEDEGFDYRREVVASISFDKALELLEDLYTKFVNYSKIQKNG